MGRLAMRIPLGSVVLLGLMMAAAPAVLQGKTKTENAKGDRIPPGTAFRTSDRCVACHNGMKTSEGEDISIGLQWSATIMANSSRDPYWQGSVRRESIDHPESKQAIEDECSVCHMPAVRMADRDAERHTDVFSRFPIATFPRGDKAAADGVTCSVCHQIEKEGLGTPATFVGDVKIAQSDKNGERAEYGPFDIDKGHQTVMHSSTALYRPTKGDQMRDAGLCGSCHTLITSALGPHGEKIARFPEQVPYQEWQHSDYATKQTCQACHMPEVKEPVAITALYGQARDGMHRHVFVGGNFMIVGMLQDHRDELATAATPEEMDASMKRTTEFLKTQAAKVTIGMIDHSSDGIAIEVHVENLGGHKLPTAYPSRRAWLHVVVRDANGHVVFESGALNPDGSIVGNDNDQDPLKYEPHYREITRSDQVEIYEPILKDSDGKVTTGLLHAVGYLKDNRLLPHGFDKATAEPDITVKGGAADDPGFNGQGSTVRYVVSTGRAAGPFKVEAELWYQPIGYRWAHNLAPYKASEPQRMVRYYEEAARKSAVILARAEATR
jgi:cytochrome c551/c552